MTIGKCSGCREITLVRRVWTFWQCAECDLRAVTLAGVVTSTQITKNNPAAPSSVETERRDARRQ